jgi:hypothetical protein
MDCVHADEAIRFQVQLHPNGRSTMAIAEFLLGTFAGRLVMFAATIAALHIAA